MLRNDRGTRVGVFSSRVPVTFPQSRMANEWFIDANGQIEGPISFGELRVRAAEGALQPENRVSSDRKYWVNANSLPELTFPATSTKIDANGRTGPRSKPARPLVETVVSAASQLHDSAFVESEPYSPLDSIPGYEIQGTLGTGACGVVFRAVQKKLNRVLALKTVKMSANTPPELLARFNQEAVSLARLQHPNIVSVYDCGHTQGRAYFAMELLEGEDLSQRLDHGPLDERTAWLIARQTAAALDHAAKLGVVHRDIKPANLFLVPPPTGFPLPTGVPMVKVTDFGLALTRGVTDETEPSQTSPGVILGTPIYMAPEQFSGPDVDLRADIYSLGATMYQVLTGKLPFDGKTVWDVMMKKSVPAPRIGSQFTEASADLIAAMLAIEQKDRPQNYSELIARIDALPCLDGAFGTGGFPVSLPKAQAAPQPPVVTAPPRRRASKLAIAVGVLVVLVAGIVFAVSRESANRKPQNQSTKFVAGEPQALFNGTSVFGWQVQGWTVEDDEEPKPVLTGRTNATRPLPNFANFRVYIAISLHEAKSAEVVVATSLENPATQWLFRLDRDDGAVFGKRTAAGVFEPLGDRVKIPNRKERLDDGKTPYVELRYEKIGNTLFAAFDGKPLGRVTHDGLATKEFRMVLTGGNIRIESATIEELVEQN